MTHRQRAFEALYRGKRKLPWRKAKEGPQIRGGYSPVPGDTDASADDGAGGRIGEPVEGRIV